MLQALQSILTKTFWASIDFSPMEFLGLYFVHLSDNYFTFISKIRLQTDLLKCTNLIQFVRSFLIPCSLAFVIRIYIYIHKPSSSDLYGIWFRFHSLKKSQLWSISGSAARWLLSPFGSRPWFSQTTSQGMATRMKRMEAKGDTKVDMLLLP